MEFKSIEFTGDHSIKTTYMAGDGNQDEYTVTCLEIHLTCRPNNLLVVCVRYIEDYIEEE